MAADPIATEPLYTQPLLSLPVILPSTSKAMLAFVLCGIRSIVGVYFKNLVHNVIGRQFLFQ